MPIPTIYGKALVNIMGGETAGESSFLDWLSDTIKVMLTTSAYTPTENHEFISDVTNEVVGTGYVAGGATLASKTITYVPDTSANAWATATAYALGDIVRPVAANGRVYICVVAGTSHASVEPVWPTVAGQTIVDATVTWAEYGKGFVKLDAADVTWADSTLTARRSVVYKDTGTPTTSPVLRRESFDQDESSSAAPFTIIWNANGIITFGVH